MNPRTNPPNLTVGIRVNYQDTLTNPPSPPFRKGGVIEIKPNGAIGLDDNLTPL
jgi:hypothetical protein